LDLFGSFARGEHNVYSDIDYELRNFIAHNYEGIDLYIVEDVINTRLDIIKKSVEKILND